MKDTAKDMMRAGSKIGALGGLILFAILGLVPMVYIGSFGSVAALAWMTGGPIAPTLVMRALIVIGTVGAVLFAATLSTMAGAVLGTVLGYVAEAMTAKDKSPEAEAAKEHGK